MKQIRLKGYVNLLGEVRGKGRNRKIDYFLLSADGEKNYAFTRCYTNHTYELCKSGIDVNSLLSKRTRDTGIMNLIKYTKLILPTLVEEYSLQTS